MKTLEQNNEEGLVMDFVVDSYLNGQFSQMKRQWRELNQENKEYFINQRLEELLSGNDKAIKGIMSCLLLWSVENEIEKKQ